MIARALNDIISELLVWVTQSSLSVQTAGEIARWKTMEGQLLCSMYLNSYCCVLSSTTSVDRVALTSRFVDGPHFGVFIGMKAMQS